MRRLPWAPIEAALTAGGGKIHDHFSAHSVWRWRRDGIPENTADRICCDLLNAHLADIVGWDVYDGRTA